jgi:hypothetical protein
MKNSKMNSLGKHISEPEEEQQKELIGEKHQRTKRRTTKCSLWGKTSASPKKNSKIISSGKNISEPKEEQQRDLFGEKHQ